MRIKFPTWMVPLVVVVLLGQVPLAGAAQITIFEPTGVRPWIIGQEAVVRWQQQGATDPVLVVLKKDGTKVGIIGPAEGRVYSDGIHEVRWAVPDTNQGAGFTVRVRTKGQPVAAAAESQRFRIEGVPRVTVPGLGGGRVSNGPLGKKEIPPPVKAELEERRAELKILSVEKASSDVVPGRAVSVIVYVANTGTGGAEVFAGTGARGGIEKGTISKLVKPGEAAELPLQLTVVPSFVRDDVFKTDVFLVKAHATGTGVMDMLWRDGNNGDNTKRIEYPITPPTSYTVSVTLERITVHYDCDDASPGDWNTRFSLGQPGDDITSWEESYIPGKGRTMAVDSGRTYTINRTLEYTNADRNKDIRISMSAIDDDDFLTGRQDYAGIFSFNVPPEDWKKGIVITRDPPPSIDCPIGDSLNGVARGAFTAVFRITSTAIY